MHPELVLPQLSALRFRRRPQRHPPRLLARKRAVHVHEQRLGAEWVAEPLGTWAGGVLIHVQHVLLVFVAAAKRVSLWEGLGDRRQSVYKESRVVRHRLPWVGNCVENRCNRRSDNFGGLSVGAGASAP